MYDQTMCFVNCHFAAHLEAVNRRNADFDHVYRTMTFSRPSNLGSSASGMMPYLLLSCSLVSSMYLLWLVYRSGLPLVLSVAAGASSVVQMLRSTNVCICFDGYNCYLDLKINCYLIYPLCVNKGYNWTGFGCPSCRNA